MNLESQIDQSNKDRITYEKILEFPVENGGQFDNVMVTVTDLKNLNKEFN